MFRFSKYFFFVSFIILSLNESYGFQDSNNIETIDIFLSEISSQNMTEDEKRKKLQSTEKLITTVTNDTLRSSYYLKVSIAYYGLNDFDSFLKYNQKSLEISIREQDSLKMARSYRNFGSYYISIGNNYKSYYNTFKASKIYERLNEKVLSGKTLLNMAIIQKNVKDYVGSEVSIVKALRCFSNTEDYFSLFSLYDMLGNISRELERFEDAIKYHNKAFEFAGKNKNSDILELKSLNNLGLTYERQKVYSKAIIEYGKALKYNVILDNNPDFYAIILDNMAFAKFRLGDHKELPELFFKPLKIYNEVNNLEGEISVKLHLSEYYESLDSLVKSKNYASEARLLAKQNGYNNELLKSMLLLSKVSKEKEALSYAQNYITLNDSLQQQERATRDQFARIRFETDILVEEKEQVTRQKELLVFILGALVVLSILIFVIFKQQQINKDLLFAEDQRKANEEIYRLMLSQQVKLEEGRQMEKRRVSEELHDGVLGRLFGTRLGLDGLNQRIDDDQALKRGQYIVELASIEKEIRRISHDLSSNTFISEIAFVEVVEKLVREHSEIHKLNYEFETHPGIFWEEIKDAIKINIYRIIQEALQNIAKHSKAKNVEIRFDVIVDQIKITILDDGIGFSKFNIKKGIGLKNISNRVKEIGGELEFRNHIDSGAMIAITIAMP